MKSSSKCVYTLPTSRSELSPIHISTMSGLTDCWQVVANVCRKKYCVTSSSSIIRLNILFSTSVLCGIVSVLLCIGAIGGSFALAKHLDENPPTSVENNSSKDEADDTNEPTSKLVKVWEICTDEADLAVGDQIVLVASSNERALSMTQNSNNRAATKIVKEDDSITINDDVQIITLEEGVVENTFAFTIY